MLDAEDVNVVPVCSPAFLHHRHVIAAANSGADPDLVWCEKLTASSLSEADKMIAAPDEIDTEFVVNHSCRFMDMVDVVQALLRDEWLLGDVCSVHATLSMELLRNGTHLIDTMSYLCGLEPD